MGLTLNWRGSVWYVMGTLVDPTSGEKVRVRKSTGFGKQDRAFAENERKRITQEVMAGKWGKVVGEADTFAGAVELYVNRPVPPGKTDVDLLRRMAKEFGGRKLTRLKGSELMAWVTGRGNKPATVAREIASLNACLGYARELGVEVAEVKLPKPTIDNARERWLTAEERDRLIECVDVRARDEALFLFMTGARLGEALTRLVWADVNLEGKLPNVTLRSRKGKGSKLRARQVPVSGRCLDMLKRRAAARSKADPKALVFTGWDGEEWGRSAFYDAWREACERAGVEDFHPHDCRHTFASLLIQAGVRERLVAQLLGHTTLSLVMRYSHLAPDHLDEAVRALDTGAGKVGWVAVGSMDQMGALAQS